MRSIIKEITPGSIAEEVGIEKNDILISINGKEVKDIIDYKFLSDDEELIIEIEKADSKEVWEIEIEKDYGEELGIEFGGGLIDKAKRCSNKCIFCFIDQLPKGMRESLYFKDDDSRLSFLQGNFVTLTNMKEEDIDRIINYHISPINVSVHTTNPELRIKMLNNRFAGNILERMKRLADAGIEMNAQVVSIPDINNGEELINTIEDLYSLYPQVNSVAVVPIGITKYREKLAHVRTYTKEESAREIENVEKLQKQYLKETGSPFVRLSDEFYLVGEKTIPDADFYDNYHQIEDGVGMVRCFRDAIDDTIEELDLNMNGSFSIVTGTLAYPEICEGAKKIKEKNPNIQLDVYAIINSYFGKTITIAGLLTGTDIIEQMKGVIKSKYLIKDIEEALDVKVIVVDFTGEDLIQKINEYKEEEK
ncbi:MAG: DUF512 domain-containing protein [Clostridium sp.]|uniref:DUF512 domain-containing protein n=1 Tax=Clostridium sp. TaxID=1506 RepID=UPI00257F964A|nr:DUF512 domain-containing protein [Clostridium sp.]MBS4840620.1 DUF512 domain-containing protein [Clostridium sp.]